MRIRRKPWARPELAQCPYFIGQPAAMKNRWHAFFARPQPLHLELGCGKGLFLASLARDNPQVNYLGIDIKSDILGVARRNIARSFEEAGRETDNIALTAFDIALLPLIMGEEDRVQRIYINFCNPWPRGPHHKRRLTHPRQLAHYIPLLESGGEIRLKTDDDDLFLASISYFEQCGFFLTACTRDLARSGLDGGPTTEHEKMFTEQGIAINYLSAVYRGTDPEKKALLGPESTLSSAHANTR